MTVDHENGADLGVRVTLLGSLVNVALVAAKFVAGALSGSMGLIADGVHSTSDLATDLVVLGGIRLGRRRADATHPYGHGKYETLAGGAVAAVLVVVGGVIAWEAGRSLYAHEHNFPGACVLAVAAASILAKEWIFHRTIRAARESGSAALHANAWHHRSDALSSVAVLAGGIGGIVGWGHADQVAGLLVGLMVAGSGAGTIRRVFHELAEGALGPNDLERIREAVKGVACVIEGHRFRTRRVGRETFVDLHVLVPEGLSLVEAHRVSMQVEEAVKGLWNRPVNVMVHVEPDTPDLASHHEE